MQHLSSKTDLSWLELKAQISHLSAVLTLRRLCSTTQVHMMGSTSVRRADWKDIA